MTKFKNKNDNRYRLKNTKPKKVFTKSFVFFLIIGSIAIILYQIIANNVFAISKVDVKGNKVFTDREIIEYIDNPIEKNILTYDKDQYQDKLLKVDRIKKATITKDYPNKLIVSVEEIYPLAYIKDSTNTYYIDNSANLLKENFKASKDDLKRTFEITGINKINDHGKFVEDDNIVSFIQKIQNYSFESHIKKIDFENKSDIGIIYKDVNIDFGNLEDLDYKLKLLDTVIKDVEEKKVKANKIMLNQGENPIVVYETE
ncbi:MAG: FtsQ-type POTRA domain-containing protein [Tissierellia bacterium]|nr:FtsQ-type POTRA domain-containing protein [Tissierellia bacterium]